MLLSVNLAINLVNIYSVAWLHNPPHTTTTTTGPSRIGLKRKLPPPPQHPTPNDDNNQQSDDDTTNEAPAQPPRTRTSNARSISSTPAATPRGGGRGGGRGGASNATPLSKPKGLHRELAGLQSAPGGLAPAPKVPRLALLSTGVRGSRGNGRGGRGRGGGGRGGRGGGRGGGRAHAAVGRALMHVRRGGRGGRGRGGRAPASDGGVPAAQEQQKQKVCGGFVFPGVEMEIFITFPLLSAPHSLLHQRVGEQATLMPAHGGIWLRLPQATLYVCAVVDLINTRYDCLARRSALCGFAQ